MKKNTKSLKVLIGYDKYISNLYLEIFDTLLRACEMEYSAMLENDITESSLENINIYIAIRPISVKSVEIALNVNKLDKWYLPYYDDDLLNIGYADEVYLGCKRNIKNNLKLASAVLGPNPILMKEYSEFTYNKKYFVLDTIYNSERLSKYLKMDKIRIVFAGGHLLDYNELIAPIMRKFLIKYQKSLHVEFISLNPGKEILEEFSCVKFIDWMPYSDYREYMKNNSFHIGVAPLLSTKFRNRKYFIKYIEFSIYRIAGVYSNCLPYTLKVTDKKNGLLVDNDSESWYKALCFAVENSELMKKIAENAYIDLTNNHSAEKISQAFLLFFSSLVSDNVYKKNCPSLFYTKSWKLIYAFLNKIYMKKSNAVFRLKKKFEHP